MASVTVDFEDEDTVAIRIVDNRFFGLATDTFDIEFEERGVQGGTVTVAELSLRLAIARALFLGLAEALMEKA